MIVETSRGKIPVRYGWNALAKFGDLAGLTMDDIMDMDLQKMSVTNLLRFVYVGFVEGARKEGVDCVFNSPEDVGDEIDDDPEIITRVINAFSEMSGESNEEGKKK